ncbi:MAG: PEP-CTERM sorting domain-containing protein [Verrucomicrobia bacterium]|nr:MAG: PEP-CTERM sorting domain-containing protein [Verrucomicrobiota bacterium]
MKMKPSKLVTLALLTAALSSRAALYTFTFNGPFANSGNVPDGNLSGWADPQNLGGMYQQITALQVKLNITGGYNGDLYAYISHDNVLIPLLNRVGVGSGNAFGSSDSGFNVTFTASGTDIHNASAGGGQLTGTYAADGRTISPLSPAAAFDTASRVALSAYNNLDPNGLWYLFISDVSAGGGLSHVNSWELDIAAVPEPVGIAMGIFAALVVFGSVYRKLMSCAKPAQARIAKR